MSKEMKISKRRRAGGLLTAISVQTAESPFPLLDSSQDQMQLKSINEISSQLTFRQADEAVQTEFSNNLNGTELGQWSFRYEYHFSIKLSRGSARQPALTFLCLLL